MIEVSLDSHARTELSERGGLLPFPAARSRRRRASPFEKIWAYLLVSKTITGHYQRLETELKQAIQAEAMGTTTHSPCKHRAISIAPPASR